MKIRIFFLSFSKDAINEAVKTVLTSISDLELATELSSVSLPTRIKKFCVLRSPHVNKDSREEFEVRIYKKFLDITILNLDKLRLLFGSFSFPSGVGCTFRVLEN
jgi:small subunit ribosomal protein S10